MNYLIVDRHSYRKRYPDPDSPEVRARILPMARYLDMARRLISRFAPRESRREMLGSEDAISFVAEAVMHGDWEFDPSRNTKIGTHRCDRGRWAIGDYLGRLGRLREPPASLDHGDTLHEEVRDSRSAEAWDRAEASESTAGRAALIGGLLRHASPAQSRLILLHYLHRMSFAEIAEVDGVRKQTVRRSVHRGLRSIRKGADARECTI